MPKSFNDILSSNSNLLTEDIRAEIAEAFEKRVAQQREEVTAELREEFASRYENDKKQIVVAMDAMIKEALRAELEEFAQDKAKLAKDRIHYKKAIKEHANILEEQVKEILSTELIELHEDREKQKANFGKLEEFVIKKLTDELNEFQEDKRALVEQKVKMIREGKKIIENAKREFIKKSAKKINSIVENVLYDEISSLREDIQRAKENEFGRKIFESFASEFMTNTLSESTQTAKLVKEIENLNRELAETQVVIKEKDKQLQEAVKQARIAQDLSERKQIMSEMLGPLTKNQREIMATLLESVKTSQLRSAYKKYLPSVLSEDANTNIQATRRTRITESERRPKRSREVSGDKRLNVQPEVKDEAEIIEIRKLAGLS